jgi:hypothetical protein
MISIFSALTEWSLKHVSTAATSVLDSNISGRDVEKETTGNKVANTTTETRADLLVRTDRIYFAIGVTDWLWDICNNIALSKFASMPRVNIGSKEEQSQ